MANQMIYKDVGTGNETAWGSSINCTTRTLHIKSSSLGHIVNKEPVDDTMSTPFGPDRITSTTNENKGDITGYHTPRTMHTMWELVMGTRGVSSAVGASGVLMRYYQSVGGSMVSNSFNFDRNNTQEVFNGVRATSLEVSGSNNKLEFTASMIARTYSTNGTSMQDLLGETIRAASFADVTVTVHQGASYGTVITTVPVSEWSVKYDNKSTEEYQSGSRDISRTDAGLPEVTGKLKIFHSGSSFVNLASGCSEAYIRFDITYPSCAGLVNGITPYTERIDIPNAELKSSIRNYAAAEKSIEDVEFMGKLNTGLSSLIIVTQTLSKVDVD